MNKNFILKLDENLNILDFTSEGIEYYNLLKNNNKIQNLQENYSQTWTFMGLELCYLIKEDLNGFILMINVKDSDNSIEKEKFAFLGQMLSSIMHDVNGPLNVVVASNELIKYELENIEVDKSQIKKLLINSENSIVNILDIIDGVLSFCRNDQKRYNKENINMIVKKSIAIFNTTLKKHGIRVELKTGQSELNADCLGSLITQVIINLIKNSIEAIYDKHPFCRWIELTVLDDDKNVYILIKDGGSIDPLIAKDIFNPLFSTKQDSGGTGLGLSFCKQIIEKHKGSIELTSDKNTTIKISIPKLNN